MTEDHQKVEVGQGQKSFGQEVAAGGAVVHLVVHHPLLYPVMQARVQPEKTDENVDIKEAGVQGRTKVHDHPEQNAVIAGVLKMHTGSTVDILEGVEAIPGKMINRR